MSTTTSPPPLMPVAATRSLWRWPRWWLLLLGLAAAWAAGTALISEHVFAMAPCQLCYWQRYPYYAALAAIPLALVPLPLRAHLGLGVLAAGAVAVSGGIGFYHGGVEMGWFEGLSSCGSSLTPGSIEELRQQIMNKPLVRCDEPVEFALGISMPWWNVAFAGATLVLSPVVALVLGRR